ncbi:NADH dehydrogenase (ubiquinone) PDSW subunit isoform X1 [Tachypleus tridentatus]|uniref:NADH dehydrogenase (ubiquinone) PDSW subunit isoform X1 n=1 Tax=Tachypleus tridentatus TaxID=6853 RepID=UPI003FCF9D9E
MGDVNPPRNIIQSFANAVFYFVDAPVTWFRETIVKPNQKIHYYYHRKFQEVPGIDECEVGDVVCIFEANEQFKRNKQVDSEILNILKQRRDECLLYENPDHQVRCKKVLEDYQKAAENWFIKYGDLGIYGTVKDAYMKQKHRMIWERRQAAKLEENENKT